MFIFDKIKGFAKEIKNDNSKRWKKIISSAPFWVIVISLIVIVGFGYHFSVLKNSCKDQYAAEYWSNSSETTQHGKISVFARGIRTNGEITPMMYQEQGASISLADIVSMRNSLQGIVDSFATGADSKVSGLNSDGTPRGWEDCYSTFLKAPLADMRNDSKPSDSVDVEIMAVGGNFKALHPMEYLSGGFLPEIPVDNRQIVINDVLAWRLYKSYDVTGETVTLWGQQFTVIGVVRVSDKGVISKTSVNEPRAYVYFSYLDELEASGYFSLESGDNGGSGLTGTSSKLAINCYEVILPESVKGVGYTDLISALPSYSGNNPQMYVVRNTGRFGILKIYDYMMPVGEMSRKLSDYAFPYWEDAAQLTTEFMFIDMCFILVGVIGLFIGIVMTSIKYSNKKEKNT